MAEHVVNIINGSGCEDLIAGLYNVTANVTGYLGDLDPTTFTATAFPGSQAFTLAATGTLTVVVNETGAEGGTPITGGTMIRCNSDGSVTYGTEKTIDSTGNCIFDHVPYGDGATPYTFYVKQLTSDSTHNIQEGVQTISMASQRDIIYIQNIPVSTQLFTLVDEYYSGLNLDGTLTFDGPQE